MMGGIEVAAGVELDGVVVGVDVGGVRVGY
jgi:hypothetical protein